MLVTLKEILNYAEANKCAIGAFHILSEDNLTAVLDAAQELRFPVIIMHSQENEKKLPLANIGPLMVDMAEKASVPVCVHLDHGMTINYIRQALIIGFSSVTYDGSSLPYEENIENTKTVVHMASRRFASVEGVAPAGIPQQDVTEAVRGFIDATGISALACSYGALQHVNNTGSEFSVPLVMNGEPDISKDDYTQVIQHGVRKINCDSEIYYRDIAMLGMQTVTENAKKAISLFGGIN